MILRKIILAMAIAASIPTAAIMALPSAAAGPETSAAVANSTAPDPGPTDFGLYIAQPQLTAMDRDNSQRAGVVTTFGAQQIVPSAIPPALASGPRIQTNTVVKNILSGGLGVVTGRFSILTRDSASLANAINTLGLKQLQSVNQGRLVMVEAPAGTDLLAIMDQLKAVFGVRVVKLDVLEKLDKAQ